MSRPKSDIQPTVIRITVPPKVVRYLDRLVEEQLHGTSRAAVAAELVRTGIRDLINQSVLDREEADKRKG